MNNRNKKRLKRIVGCVSAIAMLIGSIPVGTLVASAEGETEQNYVNVLDNENITLHGVTYGETEQAFIRMDSETAAGIAGTSSLQDENGEWVNTVYSLAREAAGGRIRFQTNSTYVAIKATLTIHDASHLSHGSKMEAAKYGFDVYVDSAEGSVYAGTVRGEAPTKNSDGSLSTTEVLVEGTVDLGEAADRDLTIYFPITSETKSVEIGVAEGSTIAPHATEYTEGKKLVFYGSSITQGGAVTKPGNTYVNTVGRNMNMEYINFGMWGRCKGEPAFADYIAGLGNISAFVYDFDHNISKVHQMEPVHYPFYETIRTAYPDIPIIMITRPGNNLDNTAAEDPDYSTTAEMKEVIYNSYQKAVAAGDTNVHFIDGESFFGYDQQYFTPNDYTHPNDIGQARMAAVVTDVLERTFAGEKNICIAPGCDEVEPTCSYDFEDDAKAEDGVDNSGATGWNVSLHEGTYTEPKFDVVKEDENNAFQLQYTRVKSSIYNGVISDAISLNGASDYTIEMKATAYKDTALNRWGYAALTLVGSVDSASKMDRFDIRIEPNGTGCEVQFYDRTNRTNEVKYPAGMSSNFEFSDLSHLYNETGTEFTYNLKVEVETASIPSGAGDDFICRVYLGYQESEEQEPVWEEPVVLKTELEKNGFNLEKIGLFAIIGKNDAVCKVTVDDIDVYTPGKHTIDSVAEVPTTTEEAGKDAHFVCSACGQQFLDANGVLKTTDAELTNARTVACTTLYTNKGPTTNDAADFATNKSGTLEVTSVNNEAWELTGNHNNYTLITDCNDGANDNKILDLNNNFGFKLDTTLYRDDNNIWTYTGLRFRKATGTGAGYYEIRIKPTAKGYTAYLLQSDTSGSVDSKAVVDDKFASAYETGTEISYQIRIVAVFNQDSSSGCFCIYVDDHDVIVLRPDTPITPWTPDTARIYFMSDTGGTGLKVVLDNIEAYKTKHTLTYNTEVPATETTTGTKAHYACSECNQKFLDEACTVVVSDEELTIPKIVYCVNLCEVEGLQMDPNSTSGWASNNYYTAEQGEDGVEATYSGTGSQSYIATATGCLNKQSDWSFKTKATIYRKDSENWSYIGFWFRRPSTLGYEIQLLPTADGYTLQLMDRTSGAIRTTYTRTVTDEKFAAAFADAEVSKLSYNLQVIMDGDENHTSVKFHVWVDDNFVETFEIVPDVKETVYPTGIRAWLYSTDGSVGHKIALDNTEIYKTTHNVTAVEATPSTEDAPGMKAHYLCSDCGNKFLDEDATIAYAKLTDILCQTRQNKDNQSNTDIRFIAYVDDYTQYSGVKFTITRGGQTGFRTTTKAYTGIDAAGKIYTPEDVYGVTEGHFATFILGNNTEEQLGEEMTVTITWIATDGTSVVKEVSRTLRIEN